MLAVRPGVGVEPHQDGGQLPVALGAELDADFHRVPGPRRDELQLAVVAEEHGPSGLPGEVAGHVLDDDVLLGAEAPAHAFLDHPYLVLGDPDGARDDPPHVPGNLGGSPEHEPSRVDAGVDDVRLHGRALHAVGLVAPLDHDIGLGETGLDVAYAVRGAGREVAMRVRAEGKQVDYRVVAAVPSCLPRRR